VSTRSATGGQKAGRPAQVADLLYGGEPYEDWQAFNWRFNRFYLLNAERVMGLLRLSRTALDPYMRQANTVIFEQTEWPSQFRGEYLASKTQLYPDKLFQAKLFDKAVALTVALELAGKATDPSVDVYRYLRIAPAFYYLDDFTRENWERFRRDLEARPERDRPSDIQAVLNKKFEVSQPAELLREMQGGFCVTRDIVEGLMAFSAEFLGDRYRLGALRRVGEGPPVAGLGTKAAAPSLRPPRGPD